MSLYDDEIYSELVEENAILRSELDEMKKLSQIYSGQMHKFYCRIRELESEIEKLKGNSND